MTHHTTGTGDVSYDLVSVLYHTLQEASTIQQYIDDATARSDAEVASFLEEIQEQDRERAHRAKSLLAVRFDDELDDGQRLGAWRPHASADPAEGG